MKLFLTNDISIINSCQSHFFFNLPSVLLKNRAEKFDIKYNEIIRTHYTECNGSYELDATQFLDIWNGTVMVES